MIHRYTEEEAEAIAAEVFGQEDAIEYMPRLSTAGIAWYYACMLGFGLAGLGAAAWAITEAVAWMSK